MKALIAFLCVGIASAHPGHTTEIVNGHTHTLLRGDHVVVAALVVLIVGLLIHRRMAS